MIIKSMTFKSKDNEEEMLSIFLLDNNGNEIDKYTFYNKKEEIEVQPHLKASIQNLPDFLELIYKSGKNNEQVLFTKEEVSI